MILAFEIRLLTCRRQKWADDGGHFVVVSLKSLGLTIQLNHSNTICDNPIPGHAGLLVLHVNGIHEVSFTYCGCSRSIPHHHQLLRRRIYPASQVTVRTCATFELLRVLHMLALTTKSNTYDFYRALEKLTAHDGVKIIKSRYKALMRIVLQWRHLKLLKRGGRGNEPTGALGTQDGELAIMCPSCPRPDINLLPGWEKAPPALRYVGLLAVSCSIFIPLYRFLYVLILCMDANFRLKNQLVSNYSQDPGLGIGWAYMVPRAAYERYVLSRATDSDVSSFLYTSLA